MAIVIGIIVFLGSLGLVAVGILRGRSISFTLLEYQRAVLYRRGLPVRELGSGRHRVWSGIEKLIIVDTRPIQVSFENHGVALRDGSTAIYAVSGTACVQDVRKAIYCARNYNQVPGFVLLCCTRLILNGFAANELRGSKDTVAEKITDRAKPRLAAAGFELLAFHLSQLSVAAPKEGTI
jgi:regulator of protease activity HflC (stomatin/prohibitin superfamily)